MLLTDVKDAKKRCGKGEGWSLLHHSSPSVTAEMPSHRSVFKEHGKVLFPRAGKSAFFNCAKVPREGRKEQLYIISPGCSTEKFTH